MRVNGEREMRTDTQKKHGESRMQIDTHPKRRGKTPEEIAVEQRQQAEALKAQKQQHSAVPAKVEARTPAPMMAGNLTYAEMVAAELAPSSFAGQLIKFNKGEKKFLILGTEEEISPDIAFIALMDEAFHGWVKFGGEGEPPTRVMGPIYGGKFVKPTREELGDLDQSQWKPGLNGQPADPWLQEVLLPLQNPQTQALYTFGTNNSTGRNAVGRLLHHYNAMLRRNDTTHYPVVRLTPSGYQDRRYGWVDTPSFTVVGRVEKNSAAVPDTSIAVDMDDGIPGL
jgi:hypothetical protein